MIDADFSQLPLTDRQFHLLLWLDDAPHTQFVYSSRDDIAHVRRRGRKVDTVPATDLSEMIRLGYIGRHDERPVWHISARGGLAIDQYIDGDAIFPEGRNDGVH